MQRKVSYTLENVAFHPRETELSWTFAFPADAVFTALEQAARRRGLRPAMARREHGLIIAKPPLSPFSPGRKVVFSLTALSPARTRVKAQYLHGTVILQSRESRLDMLDTVLRSALLGLDTELDARTQKAAPHAPPPATKPAPAPPGTVPPAPAPQAPGRQPAEQQPQKQQPAEEQPPAPQPAAQAARPRRLPSHKARSGLDGLDFGRLDWKDIPLKPPPPEDHERYRKAADSGRLSMAAKLLWLILGVGLFFVAALLAGALGGR